MSDLAFVIHHTFENEFKCGQRNNIQFNLNTVVILICHVQGCLAPIKVIIPPGSILQPSENAAVVGGNVLTSQRVVDVIFRAFEVCAASQVRTASFVFMKMFLLLVSSMLMLFWNLTCFYLSFLFPSGLHEQHFLWGRERRLL